jgi:hypothetical protein
MTIQPKSKKSPLKVVGAGLAFIGWTFSGLFVIRQIREMGTGHTYYGFITAGIVLALVGFIIFVSVRRNPCSASHEQSPNA